jgi:hypothetical protein
MVRSTMASEIMKYTIKLKRFVIEMSSLPGTAFLYVTIGYLLANYTTFFEQALQRYSINNGFKVGIVFA